MNIKSKYNKNGGKFEEMFLATIESRLPDFIEKQMKEQGNGGKSNEIL